MGNATSAKVSVEMQAERDTKNTIRFAETAAEDEQKVGTIYVPKSTLADLGNPSTITLTIESA